jgi:hypothetical protein
MACKTDDRLRTVRSRGLLIIFFMLFTFMQSVQPFGLIEALRFTGSERGCQSLIVTGTSQSCSGPLSSANLDGATSKNAMFPIVAQANKNHQKKVSSNVLTSRMRLWMRIIACPMIGAVLFIFVVPNANAAIQSGAKHNNGKILTEMQSILLKGFISGACINFAKNVILHPIETGENILHEILQQVIAFSFVFDEEEIALKCLKFIPYEFYLYVLHLWLISTTPWSLCFV